MPDLGLEAMTFLRQRLRGGVHVGRGRAGLAGAAADVGDMGGDFGRAGGGMLHVAGDFPGGGALLFDRGRNRGGDIGHPRDGAADLADRGDGVTRRRLQRDDLLADLAGRRRRLRRQLFDLGSHHGEAAARSPGACRLDGGVQRQQIGLSRNGGDQLDHVADAFGRARHGGDAGVGLVGLPHRLGGDLRRLRHLAADLPDRRRHLLRGGGDRLHVLRRLCGRRRHRDRQLPGAVGVACQRIGRGLQPAGRARHGVDDLADGPLEGVGQLPHLGLALGRGHVVLLGLGLCVARGLRTDIDLEGFHRPRHLADLVAAPEPRQHHLQLAGCQLLHGARHVGDRAGDAVGEIEDHETGGQRRQRDDPHQGLPQPPRIVLGRAITCLGRRDHREQRRAVAFVDGGEVVGFLAQRAIGDHVGHEAGFIGLHQFGQLRFQVGRQAGRRDLRLECRGSLLQRVAVLLVAAQHEVLFMAAHGQHQVDQAGGVDIGELAFDVTHGVAQPALQAVGLGQSQHALRRHHVLEAHRILVDAGT